MPNTPYRVLFVGTANATRSILAEAILRHADDTRFTVFSAGSHPTGVVHPHTLATLQAHGYAVAGLRSKSWDEFTASDAAALDFVFTLCPKAASEICQIWPGQPLCAHWGMGDPAGAIHDTTALDTAFVAAFSLLKHRIDAFLALPPDMENSEALQRHLDGIGLLEKKTPLDN